MRTNGYRREIKNIATILENCFLSKHLVVPRSRSMLRSPERVKHTGSMPVHCPSLPTRTPATSKPGTSSAVRTKASRPIIKLPSVLRTLWCCTKCRPTRV
uniref:Uncharacterized protein n=1 Tax=Cacopsylla melanoneura TaxID=428564 RepID=A0A8D8PU66_9HEMI